MGLKLFFILKSNKNCFSIKIKNEDLINPVSTNNGVPNDQI